MSVINQMLKDLEQRAPEQGHAPIQPVAPKKASTLKIVLMSALVLLSLNALGFYIWNLQARVAQSELKQQKTVNLESIEQVVTSQPIKVKKPSNQELQQVDKPEIKQKQPEQKIVPIQQVPVQQINKAPKPSVQLIKKEQSPVLEPTSVNTDTSVISAIPKTKTGKMSVSRRQLTSKELVTQKLASAEKALNINKIAKAEQFFEEILIIDPEHKESRKKLAALWFGRKSYQQAVNLLSQGIAIDRQDGELRLMKARIHFKQGQHEAAYNALKPLASFEQEEYQLMLANVAQQIEQYPSAISAYQVLINMQPYSGRWHLGLAIVYDKNSQFPLAVNEYALALSKADLSASSAKFAEQRMQALGE